MSNYRSSTPDPPITLSLGSWQITEEDLPLYAGLASGILLLIIVIMTVTTWRVCHTQRRRTKHRRKKGIYIYFYDKQIKLLNLSMFT